MSLAVLSRAIITATARTARFHGSTGKHCPIRDHALRHFTQRLIALRAEQPLLRRESWRDGLEIRWFNAGGGLQQSEQWDEGSTLGLAISRPDLEQEEGIWHDVLMLFNPFEGDVPFQIPQFGEGGWVLELSTAEEKNGRRHHYRDN